LSGITRFGRFPRAEKNGRVVLVNGHLSSSCITNSFIELSKRVFWVEERIEEKGATCHSSGVQIGLLLLAECKDCKRGEFGKQQKDNGHPCKSAKYEDTEIDDDEEEDDDEDE
tara:strand:- start:24 stop:362 length:339 start_codon:yes stop_codon:yes gene_type:complete